MGLVVIETFSRLRIKFYHPRGAVRRGFRIKETIFGSHQEGIKNRGNSRLAL